MDRRSPPQKGSPKGTHVPGGKYNTPPYIVDNAAFSAALLSVFPSAMPPKSATKSFDTGGVGIPLWPE